MKHFPPVNTSFSSLNHFTTRGADPVKADLITTCEPGEASWDSGLTVKAGGSGVIREETEQAFQYLLIVCTVAVQADVKGTALTFNGQSAAGLFLSGTISRPAGINSPVAQRQARYRH